MSKDNVIERMKESLATTLPRGSQAILYGSRARGDNRRDSDWDVLILLDKPRLEAADHDTISFPLRMLGWEIDEDINPILYTKEEWRQSSFTPFYHNVTQDGIALI